MEHGGSLKGINAHEQYHTSFKNQMATAQSNSIKGLVNPQGQISTQQISYRNEFASNQMVGSNSMKHQGLRRKLRP